MGSYSKYSAGINKTRLSNPEHKRTYFLNVTFQNINHTECFLLVSFFKKGKIAKHLWAVKVI